jgi:hypothetical protein
LNCYNKDTYREGSIYQYKSTITKQLGATEVVVKCCDTEESRKIKMRTKSWMDAGYKESLLDDLYIAFLCTESNTAQSILQKDHLLNSSHDSTGLIRSSQGNPTTDNTRLSDAHTIKLVPSLIKIANKGLISIHKSSLKIAVESGHNLTLISGSAYSTGTLHPKVDLTKEARYALLPEEILTRKSESNHAYVRIPLLIATDTFDVRINIEAHVKIKPQSNSRSYVDNHCHLSIQWKHGHQDHEYQELAHTGLRITLQHSQSDAPETKDTSFILDITLVNYDHNLNRNSKSRFGLQDNQDRAESQFLYITETTKTSHRLSYDFVRRMIPLTFDSFYNNTREKEDISQFMFSTPQHRKMSEVTVKGTNRSKDMTESGVRDNLRSGQTGAEKLLNYVSAVQLFANSPNSIYVQ